MGRSYQAEPWIQDHFDALLQRKVLAEVGLLIGKESVGARDLILGLVPSPPQDGQETVQCTVGAPSAPAPSKGKKASGQASTAAGGPAAVTAVAVDVAWVVQHAEQVSRMLPGGLCLLGCYLFCSDAGYQSCTPQLWSVIQGIRRIRGLYASASTGPELVLIHADTSRRVTARSGPATAPSPTSLSISELKWAPCAANLMQLSCSWPVDCELPMPTRTTSLNRHMEGLVKQECQSVSCALAALVDNSIPASDTLLLDILTPATTKATQAADGILPIATIQLLPLQGLSTLEPEAGAESGDGGGGDAAARGVETGAVAVCGRGKLRGRQQGLAVVHKRQAWASAVQDLKADLCTSLRVRLDILVEDALSWQEEEEAGQGEEKDASKGGQHPLVSQAQPLARPYAAGLPRRVTMPALGGLPVCDYLLLEEGPAEAAARTVDLLGALLGNTDPAKMEKQVTELESAPTVAKKLPYWIPGPTVSVTAVTAPSDKDQPAGQCSTTLLGGAAVGVALAAAALAALLSNMST